MIPKPIKVWSLGNYKIGVLFADNTEGVLDLSHKGVFVIWESNFNFNNVYIDPETDSIAWSENVDICPDAAYLKIKGLTFEQWRENQLADAYH